jgi:hypothetical protein
LSYEIEYQQPQDGLEEEIYFQNNQGNVELFNQTSSQSTYQKVSKAKTANSGVTYTSLSSAIGLSKLTNKVGSAACFETFKSLKVLSLVCSYMDSDE